MFANCKGVFAICEGVFANCQGSVRPAGPREFLRLQKPRKGRKLLYERNARSHYVAGCNFPIELVRWRLYLSHSLTPHKLFDIFPIKGYASSRLLSSTRLSFCELGEFNSSNTSSTVVIYNLCFSQLRVPKQQDDHSGKS